MPDEPKDSAGAPLCAWCGKGPVPPSRGTKPRAYCSRSCVQRAHEARKEAKRVDERVKERLLTVYMKGRTEEAEAWESGAKSRDVPARSGKSRDDVDGTSRDFPKPQVTPPRDPSTGEPPTRRVRGAFGAAFLDSPLWGAEADGGDPDGQPTTEPR